MSTTSEANEEHTPTAKGRRPEEGRCPEVGPRSSAKRNAVRNLDVDRLGALKLASASMSPSSCKRARSLRVYRCASMAMDDLIEIARTIASASRLRVYRLLGERGRSLGDVAKLARLSQSTTSHHVAQLQAVGLVEGYRRGRRTIYRWTALRFSIAVERVRPQ